MRGLDRCREGRHRLLLVRTQVARLRLGISEQQIKRAIWPIVEIDHSCPATLACTGTCPAQLAHAAGAGDQIARFGIVGDMIDQLGAFNFVPDPVCRARKCLRFGDCDRNGLHDMGIRQ